MRAAAPSAPPSELRYSPGEELASSLIHGVGLILAIVGLVVLTVYALHHREPGTAAAVVGGCVFGVTLILLYTASTLYHSIPHPRAKAVLRVLDHSAIYLLIAGTYTPYCLVTLRGPWGWSLLALIWASALVGIALRVTRPHRPPIASVVVYAVMGWAVVLVLKPLLASLPPGGVLLLLLGGLAYTGGIVFYAWRRPYHHAVWHAFVLLGSILHFFSVLLYVVPGPLRY